jgi:hypothetical protein
LLIKNVLTLTFRRRSLPSRAKTKHGIKRVDRLLGSNHLHHDRLDIYRWHCHQFCSVNPQPIVLVDWADIREYERLMVLRASIAVEGRSVTLFEQTFTFACHPHRYKKTPKKRKDRRFLSFVRLEK